jgi:hypothetical protein
MSRSAIFFPDGLADPCASNKNGVCCTPTPSKLRKVQFVNRRIFFWELPAETAFHFFHRPLRNFFCLLGTFSRRLLGFFRGGGGETDRAVRSSSLALRTTFRCVAGLGVSASFAAFALAAMLPSVEPIDSATEVRTSSNCSGLSVWEVMLSGSLCLFRAVHSLRV